MIVKTPYIFRFMLPALQELITAIVFCFLEKKEGVLKNSFKSGAHHLNVSVCSRSNWNLKVVVLRRGKKKNRSTQRKSPGGESQKQIRPMHI